MDGFAKVFTSLFSPNSDHVTISLGVTIVLFVHTSMHSVECDKLCNCNQKGIITWSELGRNKDVNALAESVYERVFDTLTVTVTDKE